MTLTLKLPAGDTTSVGKQAPPQPTSDMMATKQRVPFFPDCERLWTLLLKGHVPSATTCEGSSLFLTPTVILQVLVQRLLLIEGQALPLRTEDFFSVDSEEVLVGPIPSFLPATTSRKLSISALPEHQHVHCHT
eukprot:5942942-Amphidinium_carterae.2